MQRNPYETCCGTVCTTLGCNCHTAVSCCYFVFVAMWPMPCLQYSYQFCCLFVRLRDQTGCAFAVSMVRQMSCLIRRVKQWSERPTQLSWERRTSKSWVQLSWVGRSDHTFRHGMIPSMNRIGLDQGFQEALWIGLNSVACDPRVSHMAYHFNINRLKCAKCLVGTQSWQ